MYIHKLVTFSVCGLLPGFSRFLSVFFLRSAVTENWCERLSMSYKDAEMLVRAAELDEDSLQVRPCERPPSHVQACKHKNIDNSCFKPIVFISS